MLSKIHSRDLIHNFPVVSFKKRGLKSLKNKIKNDCNTRYIQDISEKVPAIFILINPPIFKTPSQPINKGIIIKKIQLHTKNTYFICFKI